MNHGYDGNVPPLPVRAVSGSYAAVIAPPQSYASKLLNGIGHYSSNSPQQQPPLHTKSGSEAVGIEAQRRGEEFCLGKQNGTSLQNQRLDDGSVVSEHQQQECFQPLFYQSAMLNGLNHHQQQQQQPQTIWSTAQNGDANVQLTSGNIDAALVHLGIYDEVHPSLQPGALFHAGAGNNEGAQTDQFGDTEGLTLHTATLEQQMNARAAGGGGGGQSQRQLLSPLHLQLNFDNSTQPIQNLLPPQNAVYPPMHQQQQQGGGLTIADTLEEFHSRMARLTLDDQRQHDHFAMVDSQLQPPQHGIDHITESVEVPSSEHVAEIVGRMGCKIKALRAKTNTYIKTPIRGEEPMFVVTGRLEDVMEAKREIWCFQECAAEHFTQIRASRRHSQGGAPAPGHVTAYVRVPLRVVGLVVGPKGATIKRIQQETHTYIITPSREREPIFEVTGLPQNVEVARREIEHHIYQRTGNMPITTDTNASLSSLDFQISAAAAMTVQTPQQPISDNGINNNHLQRRGMAAAGAPYMAVNYAGNMQMNGGDGAGRSAAQYAANGTQQPLAYLHPQGQRRFFGGGSGLQAASEMQTLRNSGYAGGYATSAEGKAPTQQLGGSFGQPALQNTSFFDSLDSLVNGNQLAQPASVAAIFGNAMNGTSIGDGGIRYGGGAAGLLRSTSGPQQQQQTHTSNMAHSNDPYRAWSNAADIYYGYDKGEGGALGGELAQEPPLPSELLFSAPPKGGGDRGAFLFRELFGSSGSPAGFTLNGGGSSSSGISSVGNSGASDHPLSSTNSTSCDEGLGDSPTATNSSNGKGGSNSDPYHHLMISSIWSDLDSSVTPRNAPNIETPNAHQTPQLATS